ncbi:MAG: B12-binding domain-containing radical SAM protein [Kiritimatiellae bacterium]|nr:B12-binding domain-containing radical SAM protein [Kiritimatiellia bacterium]
MKVSFVFNPFSYKLHEENLRIVQRYFGLFPPLSQAWVAAIAEKHGHDAEIIDARTLRLTPEQVVAHLKERKPDVVGAMMTTYMFRETLGWLEYIKENLPKVKIVVGGYNLRVYPKESVTPAAIDFGCFNSAYHMFPALLDALENNGNLDDVPGLIYKKGGEIIQTDYGEDPDFNLYPNPARHLLPNELYAEFPTERKNFTVMVTSKGCPRGCLFCEAGRTRYNPRRVETVINEMQECYDKYGVREIDIFDYEFLIDRKRAEGILDEMIKRKLDLIWACRARIDSVDEALLKKMKESGCSRVYFGIESGLQEMLDRVHKGITLEQVRETIRLVRKHGIRALGFFMTGLPGETRETLRQTVKFAMSLDLDYVQFSKTTAKPLTSLWKKLVDDTGYDYWKEYILGNAEEAALPRPWTELTNDEIDELTRRAYVRYHSRPFFLLRHVLKLRSFDEFKRKFMAWLEMKFRQELVSKKDEHFVAYGENIGKLKVYKKLAKWSLPF